jgi:hypothetical protein
MLKLPALLYRETLEPADGAEVVGRYNNGDVAAVIHAYGEGKTFYVGALAGIAYVTPAMPPNSQVLPTEFPEDVRAFIATPVAVAGVVPPVEASDPLVEAQYMAGENGAIVVLTNWRKDPVQDLVVSFPGKPDVRSVRSYGAAGYFRGHLHEQQRGELPVELVNGVPQVKLRLEVVDFLLVD